MRIASLTGALELGGDYWRWVQASRLNRAEPWFANGGQPDNIGDWFVTQIVDRLVDFEDILLVPRDAGPVQWDVVNETCDAILLKGGNYLYPGFMRDQIGLDAVRRARIPIVVMGAGIQEVGAGGVPFTPEDVEILRIIHDSAESSSVRGHLSAEVLASIGIDNATVTGCPTLFWERRPELVVRRPSTDSAGYTFRTWLYSDDDDPYLAQFRALELLRRASDEVTVVLQGEEEALQRLHITRRWGGSHAGRLRWDEDAQMHRVLRTPLEPEPLLARVHEQFDRLAGPDTVDWLTDHTFFSWDVADYLDLYRSLGLVMGCRLHSNLLSLAQGTPAFYLTYDDRTREVVDLLSIPHREVRDVTDDLDPFGADWSPFERAYRRQYAEMVRFLDMNGLPHRLPAPEPAVGAPAGSGT
jgi:hypothetical protein